MDEAHQLEEIKKKGKKEARLITRLIDRAPLLFWAFVILAIILGVVNRIRTQPEAALALALEMLQPAFWVLVALCSLRALWLSIEGCGGYQGFEFFNLRAIWWTLATILIVLVRIAYKLS